MQRRTTIKEATQASNARSPELSLRMLANDLGEDVDLVAVAIETIIEAVRGLSKDPIEQPFALTSAPGTKITNVVLNDTTTSLTIQPQTGQAGYRLDKVQFAAAATGSIDGGFVVRILIHGRSANPEVLLLSTEQPYYNHEWDGILTTAHTIEFQCDAIPTGATVKIEFTAVASLGDAAHRLQKRMERAEKGYDISDGYKDFKSGVGSLAQNGLSSMINHKRAQLAASRASAAGPLSVSTSNINPLGTMLANTAGGSR